MKRLLLALSLFFAIPVSAAEITSKITDSIQLNVYKVLRFSPKEWGQCMVSLEQILQSTSFGGTAGAGTYDINTAGQAFSFSESYTAADTIVTHSVGSFWNYCFS
jgi:hypothetical protein